ncbi:MAG TPA: NUDIX domain-containing protein [Patescibacteria group bacterium]|nr:NUDIX domain-containing protein [Patescibacteria group bacterium]
MTKKWKLVHRMLSLKSPWVTVYADRLQDDTGKDLEYWHVDRADSVIVLAIQNGQFLLPEMQYRPGVDEVMLDFAGGRIAADQTPAEAAVSVVRKELGIPAGQVMSLKPITDEPLCVDSSFSSQKLYGFVAEIKGDIEPPEHVRGHSLNKIEHLRQKLHCLQCRLLLDEFLLQWQKDLLT